MPITFAKVSVAPYIRLECKFWQDNNGWYATFEPLGLMVHGADFQLAKNYMEGALGRQIEELLSIPKKENKTNAA
jgi:hypothetical protein